MASSKLYTWIDIQDKIESYFQMNSEKSESILQYCNFRSYWEGLTVYYAKIDQTQIIEVLEDIFLAAFDKDRSVIFLHEKKEFPVRIEKTNLEDIEKTKIRPTLSRPSFIATLETERLNRDALQSPYIFAFHSYKGGVGRTLHALALATELSKSKKVLLIDADFEAPGITWLTESPEIAFSDFLAMVHGSGEEEMPSVIDSVASILQTSPIDKNLFVLPAFRNIEDSNPVLEIKPENIYNFSDKPFILTDLIEKLGAKLGVDCIIIDLRAGISELSTGWLFDPRIIKAFVTTRSSQSVRGTATMFKILADFERNVLRLNGDNGRVSPYLIFSMLPENTIEDFKNNWLYEEKIENKDDYGLRKNYLNLILNGKKINDLEGSSGFEEMTPSDIQGRLLESLTLVSKEYDSLKTLPSNWEKVRKLITDSGLDQQVSKLTDILQLTESISDIASIQNKLKETCDNYINAEKEEVPDFLKTESIKNLVQKNRIQLPISVVIGAKGSGKTFLFKQIVQHENWDQFAKKVLQNDTINSDAIILPITRAQNMAQTDLYTKIPKAISQVTKSENSNIFIDDVKPDIERNLLGNYTVSEWKEFWLDYISWSAGFRIGEKNVGREFIKLIRENHLRIVSVFDGLEDLFKNFNADVNQQKALEALIQTLPNWLESQPERQLGAIIFVRKDLVTTAISQNSGQFIDRYKEFELKWNSAEVLRLVYWIVRPILGLSDQLNDVYILNEEELIRRLHRLWGMKLGQINSKEASTHNWVLGSLANLNKEIQSRDVVRFLFNASSKSLDDKKNQKIYPDRILFPASIRDAIDYVGLEKLGEVKKENKPLEIVLNRLETKTRELRFPCDPSKLNELLGDTYAKDIKILEDNGVISLYNGEYYMAEIFRLGMRFESSRRGRPKVLYF
jgi:cellulose biosynthesis protein BcsQ